MRQIKELLFLLEGLILFVRRGRQKPNFHSCNTHTKATITASHTNAEQKVCTYVRRPRLAACPAAETERAVWLATSSVEPDVLWSAV